LAVIDGVKPVTTAAPSGTSRLMTDFYFTR